MYAKPPLLPRHLKGKFHILFSNLHQLHLTAHLLAPWAPKYDVYFVDQLSTCIPFLRAFGRTRVVFYCHFPDKLLADGAYVEGRVKRGSLLKRIYRLPVDYLEEVTTRVYTSHCDDIFCLTEARQDKQMSSWPTRGLLRACSSRTSHL